MSYLTVSDLNVRPENLVGNKKAEFALKLTLSNPAINLNEVSEVRPETCLFTLQKFHINSHFVTVFYIYQGIKKSQDYNIANI